MTRGLGGEDPKGGSYEHLGCFVDDREDRILGSKLVSPEMTAMVRERGGTEIRLYGKNEQRYTRQSSIIRAR